MIHYKNIHKTKGYSILYLNIYIVIIYDIELSYGEAMNHLPSSSSKQSCTFSIGWPFCAYMIFHIPFESESHAEQDGVYRFWIGPLMAELWAFIQLMVKENTFSSHLCARMSFSEDLKNDMILTTILQWVM